MKATDIKSIFQALVCQWTQDSSNWKKPAQLKMSLEKDNKSHRGMSDNLDKAYGAMSKSKCPYQVYRGAVYEKVTRPVIHGAYHGVRHINTGNPAELARAKDQFLFTKFLN